MYDDSGFGDDLSSIINAAFADDGEPDPDRTRLAPDEAPTAIPMPEDPVSVGIPWSEGPDADEIPSRFFESATHEVTTRRDSAANTVLREEKYARRAKAAVESRLSSPAAELPEKPCPGISQWAAAFVDDDAPNAELAGSERGASEEVPAVLGGVGTESSRPASGKAHVARLGVGGPAESGRPIPLSQNKAIPSVEESVEVESGVAEVANAGTIAWARRRTTGSHSLFRTGSSRALTTGSHRNLG